MNGRSQGPALRRSPPLVLVGGTGRSGTHVIAELLDQHPKYASVPLEARFHAKPRGFPDLLAGEVTKQEFVRKLRSFWWRRVPAGEALPHLKVGRRTLGLHRIVPEERFREAVDRFDAAFESAPDQACRRLFDDLLWPVADERGRNGLVEMTTDNVMQAGTLGRLFPDAKFVLVVRDGRDTGASKVERRQREHHPTEAFSGVDWWLGRMRRVERGLTEIDPERVLAIGLDALVDEEREAVYGELLDFLHLNDRPRIRSFFDEQMSAESSHRDRWREGLDESEQAALTRHYEGALGELEAEGSRCAPILRRALTRTG